jgi:sulfatase modifying factor 1
MRLTPLIGGFWALIIGTACIAVRTGWLAPAQAKPASATQTPASPQATQSNGIHQSQRADAGAEAPAEPNIPDVSIKTKKPLTQSHSDDEVKTNAACPGSMLLVDGDYCTKVEQKCLESWYDKSNKKTVCERFEPPSRCVGQRIYKRFCMDRFEWPNIAGQRPEVMNRYHQAEVKCAAVGKRLCTETEWTTACEGPKYKPFPYGYVRNVEICHGDVMWDSPNMSLVGARDPDELARLWKGVRSGSQPQCVSDYGVYDMPGNADEVVSSETFSSDFRGKFDSVHTGGPWYKGVRNQCRPKIYTHDEGFYYYFLSFRCCAEPDGKETDPRTTKQRKDNWRFEKVEQIAGFTREQVRHAIKRKSEKGNCGCSKHDITCNTMCGTLLGPSAKDYPKGPRK